MVGVNFFRTGALCAALLLVAVILGGNPAQAQGDVERGAVLGNTCLGCHGIPGYRNAYPTFRVPMLGGQHAESLYLALVEYAERRRSHATMYAQAATLSDQDKRDISAWLAAQGEPRTGRPSTAARIERGREAAEVCAACHGQNGISMNPEWPSLAGQHESYLLHTLRQYQSGERQNAIMAGQVMMLSDDELRDLAAFYAAQAGLFTPTPGRRN